MTGAFLQHGGWGLANLIKFAEGENWDSFSFERWGLSIWVEFNSIMEEGGYIKFMHSL